jgi:hypothetical protein
LKVALNLITSITNGVVRFRKEVPSDMACGEDIKSPRVMPAHTSRTGDRVL